MCDALLALVIISKVSPTHVILTHNQAALALRRNWKMEDAILLLIIYGVPWIRAWHIYYAARELAASQIRGIGCAMIFD
jgi:hypothetical protein